MNNTSTLLFVHGFNVKDDGAETLDKIKPYLSRVHNIIDADYGWLGLLGVRLFSNNIAKLIATMSPLGAVGIGHSHGCMELVKACEMGAPIRRLILINPALDNDTVFPDSLQRIDVLHNLGDETVTMAKWLPWHKWGDMGRVGYQGSDVRVINYETTQLFGVFGHSQVFKQCADELADFIENNLGLRDYCGNCQR